MNKDQTLLELFSAQSAQVSLGFFLINFLLAAALAWILGRVYVRFGTSLSNRDQFARNFVVVTMTTMLIITIVKSSLALSLGLVGALSIIRFRAALKEPEELSYLFLAIAVGLGLGAEQTLVTLVAFVVMLGILTARHWVKPAEESPNLYVTVSCPGAGAVRLPQIVAGLKAHCTGVQLKRYDETPDMVEASFLAQFDQSAGIDACTRQLRSLGEQVKVSYFDQGGIAA